MNKKRDLSILVAGVTIVLLGFFFLDYSDSIFGNLIAKFEPVDWDEVKERNIVKNTVPITLVENNGKTCIVKTQKFHVIIDHSYFVEGDDLANKLQYDRKNSTLELPCNQLRGDKSDLHVWYVVEESPKHSTKYEYFITEPGQQPVS